jgi:hypothetical protein
MSGGIFSDVVDLLCTNMHFSEDDDVLNHDPITRYWSMFVLLLSANELTTVLYE